MSERRKANTDHPYFLTLSVVGWIDVFTRQRYCEKIVESLDFCMRYKGLEVYVYVIMPSHVHLVARDSNNLLSTTLRDFKSFTAKEILKSVEFEQGESRKDWLLHMFKFHARFQQQNSFYMFWQKTNYPVELSSAGMMDQKIDYIHDNPVAAGYVLTPEMWLYSSACVMSPLKVMAV